MVEQAEPPGGLTLAQAMERTVDPQLQAKYAAVSVAAKDRVWGEMYDAFARAIQAGGELLALGRPSSPEASYEATPAAAFAALRPLDSDGDVLKDGDHSWYAVRFYDHRIVGEWCYLKELNERWSAGLTLVEALESLASAGDLKGLRDIRDKNIFPSWEGFYHYEDLDKRHRELFREKLETGAWVLWGYVEGSAPESPPCAVPALKIGMLSFDFEGGKVEGAGFSMVGARVYPPGVKPADAVGLVRSSDRVENISLYSQVRIAVLDHDASLEAFKEHGFKAKFAKDIDAKLSGKYKLGAIKTTLRIVFRDLRQK